MITEITLSVIALALIVLLILSKNGKENYWHGRRWGRPWNRPWGRWDEPEFIYNEPVNDQDEAYINCIKNHSGHENKAEICCMRIFGRPCNDV